MNYETILFSMTPELPGSRSTGRIGSMLSIPKAEALQ